MTTETLTTLNEGVKTLKLSPPVPPSQAKPQWFSETGLPDEAYPYKHLLPTFDGHLKLPPLTEFEHKDPGHEALKHADPLAFLANAEVDELTPRFGSEVSGVQLSQLDEAGRQELALFVAQRGVVVSGRERRGRQAWRQTETTMLTPSSFLHPASHDLPHPNPHRRSATKTSSTSRPTGRSTTGARSSGGHISTRRQARQRDTPSSTSSTAALKAQRISSGRTSSRPSCGTAT